METTLNELTVNGTTYVPKGSETPLANDSNGLPYVIIRAAQAGVFAGYLEEDNDTSVILLKARRLYYWDGAASCSELANNGTSKPQNCKFPAPVARIKILGVIENISATEKAKKSIEGVSVWAA